MFVAADGTIVFPARRGRYNTGTTTPATAKRRIERLFDGVAVRSSADGVGMGAPVAGGTVALLGIGAAYYASHTQQQTTLKLSRAERRWQQRRVSYEGLLEQWSRFADWVDSVYPIYGATVEQYTMPAMEPIPDSHRLKRCACTGRRISASWSTQWRTTINELRGFGIRLGMARADSSLRSQAGFGVMDLDANIPLAKAKIVAAVDAIRDRANFELMVEDEPEPVDRRRWINLVNRRRRRQRPASD